jgi:uncharacterized protein YecT (DUF1311 family)
LESAAAFSGRRRHDKRIFGLYGKIAGSDSQHASLRLDRQDARLNDNYKKLMSKLSRNRKTVLVEAQRAWIRFRKTNCDFHYDPNGGSAARLAGSGCFLVMTAARAKELKDLLEAE